MTIILLIIIIVSAYAIYTTVYTGFMRMVYGDPAPKAPITPINTEWTDKDGNILDEEGNIVDD